MQSRARTLAALILALLLGATILAACGGGNDQQVSAQPASEATEPEPQSEVTCFERMTPEQRTELIEYTDQLPADEKQNDDGTSDICLMEQQPDGSYTERHYNKGDDFGQGDNNLSEYMMYSLMFGRSNALLGYGVLSGDLDVGDAMMLSLLMGNDPGFGLYRPYSYDLDRGYYRQPVYYTSTVNHIQYGSNPPQNFDGKTRNTPAGYNKPKPVPAKSDDVGKITKDPNKKGKGSIQKDTSAKASEVIKGTKKPAAKTPSTVKKNPTTPSTVAKPTPKSTPSNGNSSTGGNTPQTTAKPSSPPSTAKKSDPPPTQKKSDPPPTQKKSGSSSGSGSKSSSGGKRK